MRQALDLADGPRSARTVARHQRHSLGKQSPPQHHYLDDISEQAQRIPVAAARIPYVTRKPPRHPPRITRRCDVFWETLFRWCSVLRQLAAQLLCHREDEITIFLRQLASRSFAPVEKHGDIRIGRGIARRWQAKRGMDRRDEPGLAHGGTQ